jgi:hypothetical protein
MKGKASMRRYATRLMGLVLVANLIASPVAGQHRFGFIVPCVLAVPGFTGIEIHIGNQPADTKGCCLVGQSHTQDWISNSKAAFDALMLKLQTATETDDISINYIGGTEAA